jgi:transcriptional regulator with XRE-family HTH domain|tara:strand:+ start:7136 stop:7390 length:255 start_codon:yes stop_codon:yes gene_type:complete
MITGPELADLRNKYGFTQEEVAALIPTGSTLRRQRKTKGTKRPRMYQQSSLSKVETGQVAIPRGFVTRYRQALKQLNKDRGFRT